MLSFLDEKIDTRGGYHLDKRFYIDIARKGRSLFEFQLNIELILTLTYQTGVIFVRPKYN